MKRWNFKWKEKYRKDSDKVSERLNSHRPEGTRQLGKARFSLGSM